MSYIRDLTVILLWNRLIPSHNKTQQSIIHVLDYWDTIYAFLLVRLAIIRIRTVVNPFGVPPPVSQLPWQRWFRTIRLLPELPSHMSYSLVIVCIQPEEIVNLFSTITNKMVISYAIKLYIVLMAVLLWQCDKFLNSSCEVFLHIWQGWK